MSEQRCGWWKYSGSGRRILRCRAEWPHASTAHADRYGQRVGDWFPPVASDALMLRERRWLASAAKVLEALDSLKLQVSGHKDMRKLIAEARAIYRAVRVVTARAALDEKQVGAAPHSPEER